MKAAKDGRGRWTDQQNVGVIRVFKYIEEKWEGEEQGLISKKRLQVSGKYRWKLSATGSGAVCGETKGKQKKQEIKQGKKRQRRTPK